MHTAAALPTSSSWSPLGWRLTPGGRAHRVLLGLGAAGPLLFAAAYTLEGATRPGYDPRLQTISELSLGAAGWLQVVNFVVFGLLTAASALAWRQSLAPGRGARLLPALKVVIGLGLIVSGLCVTDPAGAPATLHGRLHLLAAYLALTATWCSMFVFAARFAVEPGWRPWSAAAVLSGLLVLGCLGLLGAAGAQHGDVGLFERLATLASLPLSVAVTLRLLAGDGRLGRAR